MKAVWINIQEAINHNHNTMSTSDKQGMSIVRETYLLKRIAAQLNNNRS